MASFELEIHPNQIFFLFAFTSPWTVSHDSKWSYAHLSFLDLFPLSTSNINFLEPTLTWTNANSRQQPLPTMSQSTSSTSPQPQQPLPSMSQSTSSTSSSSQPQQPLPSNPLQALQCSLISGKFSDLTIAHSTRRWKAHKVVICSQSPVLEAMIEHLPPTVSILYLDDYDHEAVCSMMEYLYSTNYDTIDHEPDFSLPRHIKVFCLSVMLSISGLEDLAAKKFGSTLLTHVKDLDVYFRSVKDIYDSTTSEHPALRLIVIEAAVTELPNLINESRFFDLSSAVKGFQADIYLFLMNHPSRPIQTETEYVFAELCDECGPRADDDGYEVSTECKGCGKVKTLEFY